MKTVFILQHLHVHPGGDEDVKMIGVYRSAEAARAAVDRLKTQPGFRDNPRVVDAAVDDEEDGFHIGEYELDQDQWTEGYFTPGAS